MATQQQWYRRHAIDLRSRFTDLAETKRRRAEQLLADAEQLTIKAAGVSEIWPRQQPAC
ncbi:hypothetical protein [Nocardia rhamnosiphila]